MTFHRGYPHTLLLTLYMYSIKLSTTYCMTFDLVYLYPLHLTLYSTVGYPQHLTFGQGYPNALHLTLYIKLSTTYCMTFDLGFLYSLHLTLELDLSTTTE